MAKSIERSSKLERLIDKATRLQKSLKNKEQERDEALQEYNEFTKGVCPVCGGSLEKDECKK